MPSGGRRPGAGRPKTIEHVPTDANRRTVEAMAGYGIPEDDIARVVGIAKATLQRHYRDELDLGHVKANSAVAQNLYKIATGGGREAVSAAIFWLKARAGWSEYAPARPPSADPPPLGKKDQADLDAASAAIGTEWGHLVH